METYKETFQTISTTYNSLFYNRTAMGTSSSTSNYLSWFFGWYSSRVRNLFSKSHGNIPTAHSIYNFLESTRIKIKISRTNEKTMGERTKNIISSESNCITIGSSKYHQDNRRTSLTQTQSNPMRLKTHFYVYMLCCTWMHIVECLLSITSYIINLFWA